MNDFRGLNCEYKRVLFYPSLWAKIKLNKNNKVLCQYFRP